MVMRSFVGLSVICLLISASVGLSESDSLRILPGAEEKAAQTALENAHQLLIKYRVVRSGSAGKSPAATAAFDKAFAAYNGLVESYPNTAIEAKGLIGLCELYHIRGDLKSGSKIIDRITKRFAGTEYQRKAYLTVGLDYLQRAHDPTAALKWFERIELPPLPDANDTSAMGMHNYELNRQTCVMVHQLMAKCEIWLADPEKAADRYEKLGRLFPELKDSLEDSLESEVENVLTEGSMKKFWPTLSAWRQKHRKRQASDWLEDRQKSEAAAEEKRWGKQANGLRCSIEMTPTSLRVGDPVVLDVKIKNVSDKSITFYYRYLYQAEKLVIKNDKGEVVGSRKTAVYNHPHPREFFSLIKPEEVFPRQIKGRAAAQFVRAKELAAKASGRPLLIDFRDIAVQIGQAGRFTVSLRLAADEKTVEMGTNYGFANIWTGELVSNEVEFSIRPMQRKELNKVIRQLRTGDSDAKGEAIEILKANCDEQAVDALMGEFHSGGNLHLRAVSDALVRIQDTSVLPDLLDMYRLSVRYGGERAGERQLIILLTVRGLEADEEKMDKLLMDVVRSGASVEARAYAARTLGWRKSAEVLAVLVEAAKKPEPRMQWAAIDTLGSIGSRLEVSDKGKIIEPLAQIMRNDPDSRVRKRAVSGLGQVGSELVVPILTEALKDPDLWVGAGAANYLGRHAGPDVIDELNEYLERAEKQSQTRAAEEAIKFIRQRAQSRP